MKEHSELLKAYAESGNEAAFGELVGRYIDFVYSVAMRRMGGDAHLAEDVAQTVFLDLARKAPSLSDVSMLGGWLHRHTCFVASNLQRTERRRQARERNNEIMHAHRPDDNDPESQLKSCLDEVIEELEPKDRQAVLLRFFEKQSLKHIGQVFGSSEDAAQKRVSRAVDKLRDMLLKRGVAISAVALASHLNTHAVSSPPASVTESILQHIKESMSTTPTAVLDEAVKMSALSKTALVSALVLCLAAFFFWLFDESNQKGGDTVSAGNEGVVIEQSVTPNQSSSPFQALMAEGAVSSEAEQSESEASFRERMELTLISKASGKPVEGARVDYRGWEGQVFSKQQFNSNDEGVAVIDVPYDTITHLELTVRIDGYADTKLDWRTDRGEQVPLFYTLKLDPALPIGGLVHDPDGRPIANAKVGFNHKRTAAVPARPESHEFGWIQVETDDNGRWRIDRIAADMVPSLYGGARHDDYVGSPYLFVSEQPSSEKVLREEAYVFTLKPAARVSGIVLGPDHSPIEDATVLVGSMGNADSRETKTGADGTFQLKGCQPGLEYITASAPGFAATTIRTEIVDGLSSIELKLQLAKTLRLRVVDHVQRPVAGANVWLNTMSHVPISNDGQAPLTQVEFSEKTDQDGRVVWRDAPDKLLRFDIAGKGHMRVNGFEAHPGEKEHIVKMPSALEVYGTVRDAETMNAIEDFSILAGWPLNQSADGEPNPRWSGLERHRMTFSGGQFRQVFEEAIVSGMPNPGYMLKFESEGYTPYVTRVIAPDEVQAPFDILMEPAEVTTVQVVLPSGDPAVHADIGLAIGSTSYSVGPGRLSRESNGTVIITDEKGEFKLPSDDAIHRIIVAHPEGFADVDPIAIRNDKQILLMQWGAVSGLYVSNQNVTGAKISIQSPFGYGAPFHTSEAYLVETDETGHFQIDKVPPGKYQLRWLIQKATLEGASLNHKSFMPVDVQSGETLDLLLDFGSAQFEVAWPEGLEWNESWNMHAWMSTPQPQIPDALRKNPQALSAWFQKPDVQAKMISVLSQNFVEQTNGKWIAHDVIPHDSYTLNVAVATRSDRPENQQRIAYGQKKVRIPFETSQDPVDLGVIELQRIQP